MSRALYQEEVFFQLPNGAWSTRYEDPTEEIQLDFKTDFGGNPNGNEDNTVRLQDAISSAVYEKLPLNLSDGTYVISDDIVLDGPLTLEGNGPFRTRIRNNSTTANFFTATDELFITIKGIEFDSTVTRTDGKLFDFTNIDHLRLENLRIIDPYRAGDFTSCDIIQMEDIYMVHGGRGFDRGFFFQTCVATLINKLISNMGVQTVANPQLLFDSGCDTVGLSNSVIACQAGAGGQAEALAFIHSLSPSSFAPRWVRLNNVWLESGTTKDAIRVDDVTSLYGNGIYCVTSKRGLNVENAVDLRFVNSLFAGNNQEGIRLGSSGTIDVASFEGVTASDNSQAANNTYDGVVVGGITGSASFTDLYSGDKVLNRANKQKLGINIASTNVSLINPKFGGNVTGEIGGAQLPSVMLEGGTTRKLTFVDVNLYRGAANLLETDDKFVAALGLGAGNSLAATTPGAVVRKMEVFDGSGNSLGFLPIYNAIT